MAIEAGPDEDIVSDRHGRNVEIERRQGERDKEKAQCNGRYFYCQKTYHGQYRKFVATSYKKFQVAIAHAKMCRPRIGKTLKSPRSTQGMTSDGSFLFGRASHVESEVASLLLNIGYELRKHNSMSSNLLHHLSTP